MKRDKYMGMDVHQATTVVAVIDAEGKIVLETIVATAAAPIRRLIESISGPVHVTLEETTQAEWLHELLQAIVAEVVVCDPRRNKLLTAGSKGDKADARKLAELLRTGMVRSVWHGRQTTRGLKEIVRAYETFAIDTKRTMLRIKALYRSRGIPTTGSGVYQVKQRDHWLKQLTEAGMQQRAAWLYQQLDQVRELRKEAKAAVLAEGQRHAAVKLLRTIPQVGPVRAAQIVATAGTPHRFPNQATVLEL
jgi:transposase